MVPGRAMRAGEVVVHHDVAPYNTIRRTDVEGLAVTDPAFARLVDLGVARNARLDAAWVTDNEAVLSAAIRGGAAAPSG